MANRKKHQKEGKKVGGTAAFVTYMMDFVGTSNQHQQAGMPPPQLNLLELAGVVILGRQIGGMTGVLPDEFEPATSSYHRKTMHSVTTGLVITGATLSNQRKMNRIQKSLVNAASAGYLSHLALDAKTPRGIPGI